MQSTGQARAHLSHPMQVVRSNRWKPRYRGRTGTGFSGYSKCWVNALRRNDCTKYQRVTYIPPAMVAAARRTFRNQVRMAVASHQWTVISDQLAAQEFYQPANPEPPPK